MSRRRVVRYKCIAVDAAEHCGNDADGGINIAKVERVCIPNLCPYLTIRKRPRKQNNGK